MKTTRWELLGAVSPTGLVEARLLLHHAAQLVAAVGRCLVPARPDDGHTSLEWLVDGRQLAGQQVPGSRPWRAALEPDALALIVLDDGGASARFELAGRSRLEALAWLTAQARDRGTSAGLLRLDAPYTIPAHPVAFREPFPLVGEAPFDEVSRWLSDADAVLRSVAEGWPGASPVRVWPHHFDAGVALPLAKGNAEEAPSIGAGLSPGDEGIPEPYLYVTPWPPPAVESLPALPAGGRWNREGWTGAVLTGTDLVAAGGGEEQAARAGEFLSRTIEALLDRHAHRT